MNLGKKLSGAKVSFAIFKRDLKRLLVNPVAVVVTIGVCIIPSLYAWYNIVANWDPYGNTANIKVAVVSNDRGIENDLVGKLNAGDQVIDRLKKNDQLGWTFVDSAAEAQEGVESGDYYAAIVIPKSFSSDMTSMLTGTFKQPKITYYVNEKKSAVAPKVTDTGANTIEEQINETFVSTVSSTVVDMAKKAGVDVQGKAGEAQSSLLGTIEHADSSVGKIRTSLSGLNGTIDTTKDGIASADKTLAGLSDQMPQLSRALDQGNILLGTTRTEATKFQTSLTSALTNGATQLSAVSVKANTAVGKVTGGVSAASSELSASVEYLQKLIDTNNKVIAQLKGSIDPSWSIAGDLNKVVSKLEQQNQTLAQTKAALQTQLKDLDNDATSLGQASDATNSAIRSGVKTINQGVADVNGKVIPKLSNGLDAVSKVSGDLNGVISGLEPTISQARGTLKQLSATLDQAKGTVSQTDAMLGKIQTSLDKAKTDVAALRSSEAVGQLADLVGVDVNDVAKFMTSPVKLKSRAVYPVKNYGSGVAPFYTNLALWVGGFVLIAIYKLEVDTEGIGRFTAKQGYFGRWLLMILLGTLQALIVCIGDLVIGIQCLHPFLFVLSGVLISFVYVNIIYALAIAFKHIGKAIAVILVIVQIPGSSGMYPIEMMPGFFNWLHPLLPFTYGINAMRETIGGMYGMNYVLNFVSLAVFLAIALFIGVRLRPIVLNLNLLFDRELATTGVMICEQNDLPRDRYSLRTAMRAILNTGAYRQQIVAHAASFERNYPKYVKGGFFAIFGVQVVLFILTATLDLDNDGKIVMLVLWIISVILIAAFLVNIEYIRSNLATQMRLSAMSDEELRREVREHTGSSDLAERVLGAESMKDRGGNGEVPTVPRASAGSHFSMSEDTFTNMPPIDSKGGDDK